GVFSGLLKGSRHNGRGRVTSSRKRDLREWTTLPPMLLGTTHDPAKPPPATWTPSGDWSRQTSPPAGGGGPGARRPPARQGRRLRRGSARAVAGLRAAGTVPGPGRPVVAPMARGHRPQSGSAGAALLAPGAPGRPARATAARALHGGRPARGRRLYPQPTG